MGTTNQVDDKSLLERLRADYDVAFRNWAAQIRVLRSVDTGDPQNRTAVEEARRWADDAAAVYREKRNLFLKYVIASRTRQTPRSLRNDSTDSIPTDPNPGGAKAAADAQRVRALARRIWEEAGRPSGTAEEDWFRAEEILHTRR